MIDFFIANYTRVQQDLYFSMVMSIKKEKQLQKAAGHLMNNNTIMWFSYFSECCYFHCAV